MRFGLIGAGCIGQVRARALQSCDGCELVAVSDVDIARARGLTASPATQVFDDYRRLLDLDTLDAIVVSTPPQFHEAIVVSALESGKHVLCEKPLANTVEACRRMVETANRTDKTLSTGFNHRYFPAVQFVKRQIELGAIGKLDHVRAYAGHVGLSEFRSPWEHDKNVVGGGALMDVGIHIIDLVRFLLGDVEEVMGIASRNIWNLDGSEDNGYALMRGARGEVATLQASWSEWKGYRFSIEAYGDRGMARAYYAPMMSMMVSMDRPGGRRRRSHHFYPGNMVREKLHGWQSTVERTFRSEFADFLDLCKGKKRDIADGFDGFRAVEIANAVYRCTEEKQSILLEKPF